MTMETSKSKKLLNSDPDKVVTNIDTRSSGTRRQSMLSDKPTAGAAPPSAGMPKSSLRRQTRRKPTEEILTESISSKANPFEASRGFGGHNNNTGMQTPGEKGQGGQSADDDSPSLWLKKTPEEIFEYYKQLGPEWRNEFEKTDLTYSPSSPWYNKEVIPGSGIPVIPNMSREPVGMYARSLRNRRKTALDLNSYAVELSGRPASYYLQHQDQDRRSTLSYGLNHSPSTPISRPHHAYPNGKHFGAAGSTSSSSSTSFVSRSRALVSQSVTMVTKLFIVLYSAVTYVWRLRESGAQDEGVDTVDNAIGYGGGGASRQNYYEYKTGVKRSSRSSQAASSSSSTGWSSWSQSIYQLTTWLVETNTRLFWYKDRSVDSVSRQSSRRYVKYGILAVLLLLLGFWLVTPLYSDSTSSSSSSATDLNTQSSLFSSPLFSTSSITSRFLSFPSDLLYYVRIPISSSVNFVSSHLIGLLSATSQFLFDLCSSVANFGGNIGANFVHYVSLPWKFVFSGLSYIRESIFSGVNSMGKSVFSGVSSMWEFIFLGLQSVLSNTSEFVASIPTVLVYCVRVVLYWAAIPVLYCRDLVTSLATLSGEGLTTMKQAAYTKVPSPGVVPVQEQEKSLHSSQEQKVVVPSVEDIVLRVLGDVRFQSMIEGSVRETVDSKEKQREQKEKELQEKVKELCTKLVESELVKLKAAVDKVDQDVKRRQEENIQTTIQTVTTTGPSYEEWMKYSAQVEDMLLELKTLQSEHRTSGEGGEDPMAQYSTLIDDKIRAAFAIYDADKTGLTDYALESAGGSVIDIRCTETYTLRDPYYVLFGLTLWRRDSSPRKAIQPGLLPGECWAFQGAVGCLVLKLSHRIHVTRFSMEHIPKALTPRGEIDSAPKKFAVWGLTSKYDERPTLLGEFMYDRDGPTLQFFEAQGVSESFDMVELKIQSNHGNIEYTCLYRFRVHGNIAPAPSYDSSTPLRGGTPGGARNHNDYQSEQLHQSHHNTAATTSYDPKYNPV